jgi:hypothetical protein
MPKINQAGGAALQTGMPVFRPDPPAKVVVGTGQDGCRSSFEVLRGCQGGVLPGFGLPRYPPSEMFLHPVCQTQSTQASAHRFH